MYSSSKGNSIWIFFFCSASLVSSLGDATILHSLWLDLKSCSFVLVPEFLLALVGRRYILAGALVCLYCLLAKRHTMVGVSDKSMIMFHNALPCDFKNWSLLVFAFYIPAANTFAIFVLNANILSWIKGRAFWTKIICGTWKEDVGLSRQYSIEKKMMWNSAAHFFVHC